MDAKVGLVFMTGVLLVFNVMGGSDFAWYAAGVSALPAWVTILLVPPQGLSDAGHLIANQKLNREFIGVAIASAAIAVLARMHRTAQA